MESGLDDFRWNGTFAADAPVVTAQFDDGGRHEAGFAGVEDERDAVTELAEDFVTAGAGGGAGNVGAGTGERDAKFRDEIRDYFRLSGQRRAMRRVLPVTLRGRRIEASRRW